MRKLFVCIGLVCLVPMAHGQLCEPDLLNDGGTVDKLFYDGVAETWVKINQPSGNSDWYNVDFDATAQSCTVAGIAVDVWNTSNGQEVFPKIGLYPEFPGAPNVPDLANPIFECKAAVKVTDAFASVVYYPLDCIHLGSTDLHVAFQMRPGESACFLSSDASGTYYNRSFVTSNAYQNTFFTGNLNWALGLEVLPTAATAGKLLLNGVENATVNVFGEICYTMWLANTGLRFLLYFCPGGVPFLQILPVAFTISGSAFFPAACPNGWQACIIGECGFVGPPLEFCTIYQDPLNPKVNGKPSLQVSNVATVTVFDPNGACEGCFGLNDDGNHDGFFWRVTNPSGTSDWFNVNLGTALATTSAGDTAVNNAMTSVEIGFSNSYPVPNAWNYVGINTPDTVTDPTGNTPDTSTGSSISTASAPVVAYQTHDLLWPAVVYDIPDVPVDTTQVWHATVGWQSGDTALWIASDTDGTDPDSGCGIALPVNYSFASSDGYVNAAGVGRGGNVHWAIKINWTEK